MSWFNVDDGFYDHPKVDDLPLSAVGLWTLCGTYCMRQLTDGAITESRVRKFGGTPEAVDALIEAELWIRVDGGYQFKDWSDWQMTRNQIKEKREKERIKKQKQRRNTDGTYAGTPAGSPGNAPKVSPGDNPGDSPATPQGSPPGSHAVQSNPIQSHSPTESEGARKRARTLPPDWQPNDHHRALAHERGIDLNLEAEKFRDWCGATGKTYKDHDLAFNGWIRRARPDPGRSKTSTRIDGGMRLVDRYAQEEAWNAQRQLGS